MGDCRALAQDNQADERGEPRPDRPLLKPMRLLDDPAERAAMEKEQERAAEAKREGEWQAYLRTLETQTGAGILDPDFPDGVARTS